MPTKTPLPARTIAAMSTVFRAGDLGYGTISGTVTDTISGTPIAGAVVTCEHFSYFPEAPCNGETTTDAYGNFVFENVFFHDTDGIILDVQAEGYLPRTISSTFLTQPRWVVDISLDPPVSAGFPFRRMTTSEAFEEGAAISDLWITPQGSLWVATERGLFIDMNDGGFGYGYDQPLIQVIGLQEDPYAIWALGLDGTSIHAFRGDSWNVYGPADGWEPLPAGISSDGPAVTPDGVVWLATGTDGLRRFDPATRVWSTLQATDLGFAPADPDYQGHYLTDALVLPDGSLWVSDCIGMGEGYDGQGVRALVNNSWTTVPGTEGLCIFELARDPAGRIWIGGTETFLIYDPATDTWSDLALPPYDRAQYVIDLVLDPAGEPWIGLLRCGPACCDASVLYAHEANGWHEVRAASAEALYLIPSIAFGSDGTPWTCYQGEVIRSGEEGERVGQLGYGRCEIIADGEGTLWVATLEQPGGGLWQVIP